MCVKEFGASQFIKTESDDIIQNLKETFPDIWKEIFTFAVFRFFLNSPLKNVQFHYQTSYLSEIISDAKLSSRTLSNILQTIGKQRNHIKTFLSKYIIPGESIAVDLTHIFSLSENIISATLGRNADQDYTPQINLFLLFSLDGRLKVDEEKDFLILTKDDKDKLNEFYENEKKFGTITIITGTNLGAQKNFELLKSRTEIEIVFDTFKNTLHADRSYMGDDFALEGWMFVNFIALLLYYKVYALLMSKDLLNNCSPKDVILHLSRVYKVKIGDDWVLSEIPKKPRLLIEKLGIEKTIT
jgi:hypothetical protein